ncbi:MAG: class I SAM-dependent methyltransferase [Thaumarchaeota archaeon]|nr:MAG: class I SAM-dependent methyltransferase [Nitrososphaerota archaeon]
MQEDTTKLERNWVRTYKNSSKSRFYQRVKDVIKRIPPGKLGLEHGCSVGNVSKEMAIKYKRVFGIDKSFFAILEAKKLGIKNADFFVSDSLAHPFGNRKFDLVVALNLLDIIEPSQLLKLLCIQTGKFLILSDPYDFERGKHSVKIRTDDIALRSNLIQKGFTLVQNTKHPSFVPWKLNINSRLKLHYKVDIIVAKRKLRN